MDRPNFENLEFFQLAERLSDAIWSIAWCWKPFVKDTLGKQLVRCVDSIGANIAEGAGRGSFQDNRRFVKIARGSLHETRYWLRRAYQRQFLTDEQVATLKPMVE